MISKRLLLGFILVIICFSASSLGVVADSSWYVIPDSDSRYLKRDEVESLSLQVINYAKNEIYARRGRLFKSQELQKYFNEQSWYAGIIAPEDFDDKVFNDFERINVELLSNIETQMSKEGYKLDQSGYSFDAVYDYIEAHDNDVEIIEDNDQDLGIIVLSQGEEEEVNYAVLDDLKPGDVVEIDKFGELTAISFRYEDSFQQNGGHTISWNNSGDEADYAIFKIKMLNTNTFPKKYLTDFEVKAIYDDTYEYQGWAFQYYVDDYDGHNIAMESSVAEIMEKGEIGPLYEGYYMFGCTLPNAIVESKAPLRMEIKFDGNEITHNVRE